MLQDYDIVGSFNNQRVSTIDAERTVNCFEYLDPRGKKEKTLLPTSGLANSNVTFPGNTGTFRAQFVFNNEMYVVVGNTLYRLSPDLNIATLGTIASVVGYVGITANTFQVALVDGKNGWIWDTNANTFTQITDESFPATPIDITYLDGFFIVANGNTNTFGVSQFNQGMLWGQHSATFTAAPATDTLTVGTTVNYQTGVPVRVTTTGTLPAPLNSSDTYYSIRTGPTTLKLATSYDNAILGTAIDITTAGAPVNTITTVGQLQQGAITSHPGTIVACRTLHRRLFLFSQNYTEVWENQGIGSNLPFRRNNSLLIEYGTPAIWSVAVGFDRMIFLSQDKDGLGSVMEVTGTEVVPISPRSLDFVLQGYASNTSLGVADASSFFVKENGIIFYRLNFTRANHTFVFCVTMSDPQNLRWHEEEMLNGDRHVAQTHAYFNGKNYYGSYLGPTMYNVSSDFFTNAGEAIRRMRIGKPYVPAGYNRTRIDRFQLDLLQGRVASSEIDEEVNLFTQSSLDILTESDIPIILETGSIPGNGDQPTVFLSISKDGGQTYGNRIQAPMGKLGERTFRTVWRKLGTIPRGQAFVPRIEFFDAIQWVVLGAAWSFETMPE